MPYIGNSPGTGTRNRFIYTATASQTTFSGADDNGKTLKYADSDYVDVYLNGICLVPVTDYTSTSKTSIVLTQAASLNDTLEVVAYDIATISDTVSKADGGTFEDDVTFLGKGVFSALSPNIRLDETDQTDLNTRFRGQGGTLRIETTNDAGTLVGTRLAIDHSTGDVGIGTANPQYGRLHIADDNSDIAMDANASGQIHIDGNGYGFGVALNASGAQLYTNSASRDLIFGTNETERMRITDGKVGIGTDSPTGKLHVQDSSLPKIQANYNGSKHLEHGVGGSGCGFSMTTGHFMTFNHQPYANAGSDTNLTERMRLDANGRFHIGSTVHSGSSVRLSVKATGAGSEYGVGIDLAGLNTGTRWMEFRNVTQNFGSIDWSGSALRYNSSSDYRLKTNITDLSDGITKVKQLQPREFNWIHSPDQTVDGFIAHEAATVVPEAVSGTYNEVEVWTDGEELPDGVSVGDNKLDDDGNTIPKYQGIDQSKLVPVLTAALQEAITKIETLETEMTSVKSRLDALEAG
jgi:hypothetical protein